MNWLKTKLWNKTYYILLHNSEELACIEIDKDNDFKYCLSVGGVYEGNFKTLKDAKNFSMGKLVG